MIEIMRRGVAMLQGLQSLQSVQSGSGSRNHDAERDLRNGSGKVLECSRRGFSGRGYDLSFSGNKRRLSPPDKESVYE